MGQLKRLTESFEISQGDILPIALQEGVEPLKETYNGKEYECIASYRVPISRINTFTEKNLNGRAYTKELWEAVRNNQKNIWEGCVGLADHPEGNSDGSVRDIFCVWHNLGLNENKKVVEADLHLVGPYGKLAEDVIRAGGKLGFSSSGFGELKEDGVTVDPSTYMLERVSDWVLTPSQQVYGTADMKIKHENVVTESKPSIKESKETKETKMEPVKRSKLEDRKFREDVEKYLTEATSIKNPNQKLLSLQEIQSYFEEGQAPDLREKVDAAIKATQDTISTVLQEHVKLEEEFGVGTVEELKEGVARIAIDRSTSESKARDWKKVTEALQEKVKKLQETIDSNPSPESYENALEFNRKIRISYLEKKKELQEKLQEVEAQREGQKAVAFKIKEVNERIEAEKKVLEAENNKLKSKLEEAKVELAKSSKVILEKDEKINFLTRKYESAPAVKLRSSSVMPVEFTEKADVENYFNDLTVRHGKELMAPYKERILGCKTLREAMMLANRVITEATEVKILPSNVSEKARINYLKEATGRTVRENVPTLKKPQGWI